MGDLFKMAGWQLVLLVMGIATAIIFTYHGVTRFFEWAQWKIAEKEMGVEDIDSEVKRIGEGLLKEQRKRNCIFIRIVKAISEDIIGCPDFKEHSIYKDVRAITDKIYDRGYKDGVNRIDRVDVAADKDDDIRIRQLRAAQAFERGLKIGYEALRIEREKRVYPLTTMNIPKPDVVLTDELRLDSLCRLFEVPAGVIQGWLATKLLKSRKIKDVIEHWRFRKDIAGDSGNCLGDP